MIFSVFCICLPFLDVFVYREQGVCCFWSPPPPLPTSTGSRSPAQTSAHVVPASRLLITSFSRAPRLQNSDVKAGRSRWTGRRSCGVGWSPYSETADLAVATNPTSQSDMERETRTRRSTPLPPPALSNLLPPSPRRQKSHSCRHFHMKGFGCLDDLCYNSNQVLR